MQNKKILFFRVMCVRSSSNSNPAGLRLGRGNAGENHSQSLQENVGVAGTEHNVVCLRKVPALLLMKKTKNASQAAPASDPPPPGGREGDKNGNYHFLRITQDRIMFSCHVHSFFNDDRGCIDRVHHSQSL